MAPSPTIRRLLREVAELSTSSPNPNPAFYAAPTSDSDLHEWHFTLLGPPAPSPYAGGLYHGRISLPPAYPLKPPNFRFLTPSGRFEVNREICLSISGFHEETWMPAWGVRTALTALRSFMAEPGTAGQVGGLEANPEVRKKLARESRGWKCHECSGRSNEDIMKEWWNSCRERGVEIDEEGSGAGVELESLPEGMDVTARVKGENKEKTSETTQDAPGKQTQSSTDGFVSAAARIEEPAPTMSTGEPTRTTPHEPQQPSSEIANSPPPQIQSSSSISTLHRPPGQTSPSTSTTTQFRPQTVPRPEATITLDRAITAVVLALCVMILKKIFYPTSTAGSRWDDGGDWGVGLRKEY